MIAHYNCIPFFYPKPPPEFYKSHGISLAKNESIFCSIDQLVKMAKNIEKYKAVGNHQNGDLIKGLTLKLINVKPWPQTLSPKTS